MSDAAPVAPSAPVSNYVPPVDNAFAWAMVGVPIIGCLVPIAFPQTPYLVVGAGELALNIALAVMDDRRIRAAGHKPVGAGLGAIVPVYLIVRAVRLSSPLIPMAWIVAFLVSIVVSVQMGPVTMDSAKLDSQLASTLRSQYGGGYVDVECPTDPTVRVHGSFTCDVNQGNTWVHVVVTVTDHDGRYEWQLTQ